MKYEYGCGKCGVIEVDQSIKDEKLVSCPKCTSTDFQRLITGGTGFILKGGGWFAQGYSDNGAGSDRASFDKEISNE